MRAGTTTTLSSITPCLKFNAPQRERRCFGPSGAFSLLFRRLALSALSPLPVVGNVVQAPTITAAGLRAHNGVYHAPVNHNLGHGLARLIGQNRVGLYGVWQIGNALNIIRASDKLIFARAGVDH